MTSEEHNTQRGQAIQASDFQAPGADVNQTDNVATNGDVSRGLNRGVLTARSDAHWWQSQFNLMLCVFGLLGVATVLFILITPAPETPSVQRTLVAADGATSVGETSVQTNIDSAVAPFDESQREQARSDSQEVLSELLEVKKQLEQKQVQEWAAEPFTAALEIASLGDALYQQQEYANAIAKYQGAVTALEDINELIPAQLVKRVAAGLSAVKQGKSQLAREQFSAALTLDRNHIPALEGMNRVETLDQVLELVATAALHEQDFAASDELADIELAIQKYQEAVDLDSQAQNARDGLTRGQAAQTDKLYRLAMSDGFNALFSGSYSKARGGFNQALQHKPEDITAKSALRQALASDKRTSLRSLLSNAKRFEANEQWASALSNYQTVLQRDANQVSANIGRIRSQARLDLDAALKSTLQDRLALSRGTNNAKAQKLLADAQAINNKGPVLKQQIAELSDSLALIQQTVKVSFNSDTLTKVTLRKAGAKRIELGKFSEKKLALKPGRYTVTGTRLGFQDVRTEIELRPGAKGVQRFTVACTQLVATAG